jgi:hypothetical protein
VVQHWKYFALALSSVGMVGFVLHGAACGRSIPTLGSLNGTCDAGDSGTCECLEDAGCPADFCANDANDGQNLPDEQQIPNDCNVKKCMGGTALDVPDTSDMCDAGVCSDAGMCVECNVDTDCMASTDGGYCYQGACASCSDQKPNGDETGIDCGDASRCGLCNGTTCPADPKMCHSGVCADGFCCDVTCGDNCKSCNVKGKEGTCSNVLAGEADTMCQAQNKACDGNGVCVTGTPNGTPCSVDINCISMKCTNGICTSP